MALQAQVVTAAIKGIACTPPKALNAVMHVTQS